jgi:hypothetical protein
MELLQEFISVYPSLPILDSYRSDRFTGDVISYLQLPDAKWARARLPICQYIIHEPIVNQHSIITFQLQSLGDILIGICHHPAINKVSITVKNLLEIWTVDAILDPETQLWQITPAVVLLGANTALEITLELTKKITWTSIHSEMFYAEFGYTKPELRDQLSEVQTWNFPFFCLETPSEKSLQRICGYWRVVELLDDDTHAEDLNTS